MAEVNVNPVRKIFVFLVFFSMGHAVCGEVIHHESGTDYTFKPRITGKPETILWKYKGDKVVESENNEPYWYRLKGRAELNRETGDLTLMKLNKDDSGLYESEIQVAGMIRSSTHDIKVFDALPKPNVTCEVNGTEAKLVCSVDSSAVYEWNVPEGKERQGQTITVPKEGSHEAVYICVITNEVSSNSAELHLKNCFKEENSGGSTAIGIAIAVIVIVIIILVVLSVFIWRKCLKKKKNDYSPVDTETGNNLICELENKPVKVQDPGEDDGATQILAQNHADLEQDKSENQTDQDEKTQLKESIGQHSEDMNGTEPPNGSDGQSPENNLASTQTETMDQGTDRGAEEPTQTVEGPPLKDKDDPNKCVADPPGETMDQGTDGGEDPPGDPEDGSDRGSDECNPTSTLTDLEETKALDSISNHGNDQGQAASKPAVISNNFTNEKTSASEIEEKIEKPENLAGKPKENSSSGIVEKKIEKFEQLAWKPKEISSSGIVEKKIEEFEQFAWKPKEISSRTVGDT